MTKGEVIAKVNHLLVAHNVRTRRLVAMMYDSGMIDTDKYPDTGYQLPKMLLSAALWFTQTDLVPENEDVQEDIENLKNL